MYQLGLSVSSMLGGLFSRGMDSAPHSRENGWSPGCPVPCSNQTKIIANKTPPGLLLVGGTRCFGQAMDWWLLVVGEYKLYHSAWEPPIMCVAWKISRSLGCMLTMKVYRSKYYSPLFQNRALAPLQIPASLCEGLIYLLLCWVIILLLKSTSWRAPLSFACITVSLHWVWLYWISFIMDYNV